MWRAWCVFAFFRERTHAHTNNRPLTVVMPGSTKKERKAELRERKKIFKAADRVEVEQDALDALDIARVRKFLSTRMGILCGLGIVALTAATLLFALPPAYAVAWVLAWTVLSSRLPRFMHLLVSVFTLWYIWCFRLGLLNERPIANSCKAIVLAVALHAGAGGCRPIRTRVSHLAQACSPSHEGSRLLRRALLMARVPHQLEPSAS